MILEWIRFGFTAVLVILGLFAFVSAAFGVNKYKYVLNRLHAASVADTLGLMLICVALIVASGVNLASIKIFLVLVFMWVTSPVSAHLLTQIEIFTSSNYSESVPYITDKPDDDSSDDTEHENRL